MPDDSKPEIALYSRKTVGSSRFDILNPRAWKGFDWLKTTPTGRNITTMMNSQGIQNKVNVKDPSNVVYDSAKATIAKASLEGTLECKADTLPGLSSPAQLFAGVKNEGESAGILNKLSNFFGLNKSVTCTETNAQGTVVRHVNTGEGTTAVTSETRNFRQAQALDSTGKVAGAAPITQPAVKEEPKQALGTFIPTR